MYTLARSIHPNDINRLEDGLKVVSIEQKYHYFFKNG